VSRRDEKESGITVLTLSNGMEVWLKPLRPGATAPPAPIGAPSISFAVLARGGASLAPPAERSAALLAGQLVAGGGVGGMTPAQRAQALQGRPIVVQPFVTANAHGMNASARPPDIDAVLNLVHLHFTAPNVGLDDNTRDVWGPISDEIKSRVGFTPDAYALSVYDAAWIAALSYIESHGGSDLRRAAFARNAQRYWGLTGSTALDANGDRKSGNFDFWLIRDGQWVRAGQYVNSRVVR